MLTKKMRAAGFALALALFPIAACNNATNTDVAYKAAINDHFKGFPACLWSQPIKFPVQAATSDDAKTAGFDALTQQGLLTRTTSEKKIIIVSRQENNYDLSDKGRSTWTPDTGQPGYGNFCYGNREVTSTELVLVPAQVKGHDGKPLLGLKQEDFVLRSDGKPQPIRVFEQTVRDAAHGCQTAGGASSGEPGPKRPQPGHA